MLYYPVEAPVVISEGLKMKGIFSLFLFDMAGPVTTAINLAISILILLIVLGLTATLIFGFVLLLKGLVRRY